MFCICFNDKFNNHETQHSDLIFPRHNSSSGAINLNHIDYSFARVLSERSLVLASCILLLAYAPFRSGRIADEQEGKT